MRTRPVALTLGLCLLSACTPVPSTTGGNGSNSSNAVACTMEAKICPDGSYVGRQGPNCEFALCPGEGSSSSASDKVSDGTIEFPRPDGFGLALKPEQILATSYIPQCEPGFSYCLYFNDTDYKDTNFDGAGLGITMRTDMRSADHCMQAQPEGYTDRKPAIHEEPGYTTALYEDIGDAGAGHYSHDRLYRLFADSKCYEFRQRIGFSQFGNHEPGSIEEFTASDETSVQNQLDSALQDVLFLDGRTIVFPG